MACILHDNKEILRIDKPPYRLLDIIVTRVLLWKCSQCGRLWYEYQEE